MSTTLPPQFLKKLALSKVVKKPAFVKSLCLEATAPTAAGASIEDPLVRSFEQLPDGVRHSVSDYATASTVRQTDFLDFMQRAGGAGDPGKPSAGGGAAATLYAAPIVFITYSQHKNGRMTVVGGGVRMIMIRRCRSVMGIQVRGRGV